MDVQSVLWVGSKGFNYEFNLKFGEHLEKLGIPQTKIVVEGVGHSATDIYKQRGLDLKRFHQRNFGRE